MKSRRRIYISCEFFSGIPSSLVSLRRGRPVSRGRPYIIHPPFEEVKEREGKGKGMRSEGGLSGVGLGGKKILRGKNYHQCSTGRTRRARLASPAEFAKGRKVSLYIYLYVKFVNSDGIYEFYYLSRRSFISYHFTQETIGITISPSS